MMRWGEEGMAGRREERIPDATLLRRSEASGNQKWEDQGGRLEGGRSHPPPNHHCFFN